MTRTNVFGLFLVVLLQLCCLVQQGDGQPRSVRYELLNNEHSHSNLNDMFGQQEKAVSLRSSVFDLNTTVVNASFDHTYTYSVNLQHQYLFIYTYNETNSTTAVRVSATSSDPNVNFPVMFVVRQQEGILSWQIPLFIDYVHQFSFANRTLCPVDKNRRKNMTMEQLIYIDVSTMAAHDVHFTFSAQLLKDFQIHHGSERNVTVSPSQPQYYMYTFPPGVDTVLLRVTSPRLSCAVVSVQPIRCPIFDLDRNIDFEGKHQTMTNQAAIFLQRSDYEDFEAFYVVIVMKPNNQDCLVPDLLQPTDGTNFRHKTLTISITDTISSSQYYRAIFAALAVFLGFYIVAAAIGCIYHGCGWHQSITDLTEVEKDSEGSLLRSSGPSQYGAVPATSGRPDAPLRSMEGSTHSNLSQQSSDLDFDSSDIDFLPDAELEKDIVRTKTMLFVSDLARKSHKKLSKTFKIYHWNLLTIAIFYGLPVAQLVLTYQQSLLRTGDEDLCYYNFDCAHPLDNLSAFNNIASNMGYVLLGLLFIVLVWRRDVLHGKLLREHHDLERQYGIPQHYGLLYAMGLALVMEGVMSACYHVCPNYSNFQFDTSFMYIIACLSMLKIYETRHPDVQAKAYQSYFSMALVIFIAVLGVVYGSNIFWIFYALVHMLSTLVLSAQIYYVGRIKVDRYVFKRLFRIIKTECFRCVKPMYVNRFVMLLVGNLINWAFALYGAIVHPSDFASFLLAIFIGNLLLYLLFYIIMKLLSKERINGLAILCIGAASITWGFALYFFFQHLTSWHLSPAQSRQGNRPCILLDFYDAHDVWHFLSSASMFFSFLILLTLDDDLYLQRRDRIPVF
ncbi:SID1 transmembrane family member 1-like isoform X2 [Babylonia areolata]|uniref:SID1 transmembrane family member 1-like isoform X2 n=1 Tax=Babylonia areolata TaxID=304850 RepID=UPI003FD3353D